MVRRVCFVTCLRWPEVSESDGHVQRALEARGVVVVLNEPGLFFTYAPTAAEVFADAICRRFP